MQAFLNHYPMAPLSAATQISLEGISKTVDVAKEQFVIKSGTHPTQIFFLIHGAVRSFYLKDGVEVNTWFAFENELVGSFDTYLMKQPASEAVEALESCQLLAIDMNELKKLSSSNLELSNLVLALVEEYAAFLHYRLNVLQFQSAQERYKELLKHESEMLQRVSLTHIASYLGVSRETLSRMRAKK